LLATIGRAAGVANVRGLKFAGVPAWLLWLFVHIFFLIGFRNRLLVLFQWAWLYFTYDRGARLITGTVRSLEPVEPHSTTEGVRSVV
jgi:NADH dehydrogenase